MSKMCRFLPNCASELSVCPILSQFALGVEPTVNTALLHTLDCMRYYETTRPGTASGYTLGGYRPPESWAVCPSLRLPSMSEMHLSSWLSNSVSNGGGPTHCDPTKRFRLVLHH